MHGGGDQLQAWPKVGGDLSDVHGHKHGVRRVVCIICGGVSNDQGPAFCFLNYYHA